MTGLYPECCVVYMFDQFEQNQFVPSLLSSHTLALYSYNPEVSYII